MHGPRSTCELDLLLATGISIMLQQRTESKDQRGEDKHDNLLKRLHYQLSNNGSVIISNVIRQIMFYYQCNSIAVTALFTVKVLCEYGLFQNEIDNCIIINILMTQNKSESFAALLRQMKLLQLT